MNVEINDMVKNWFIYSIVAITVMGCQPTTIKTNITQSTITGVTNDVTKNNVILSDAPEKWWQKTNIHAMAVSPENPEILYVATHHGLLQRSEAGKWLQVGKTRSNFTSFVAHPKDSGRFYASLHPPSGGKLGFLTSYNQGQHWQLQSLLGVDFLTLAIAPANPKVIYGWAVSGKQGLLVSKDGGKTWNQLPAQGLEDNPHNLVVDPRNPEHVFAATTLGLFESRDGGKSWILVPNSQESLVASLALKSEAEKTVIYGFHILSEDSGGFFKSTDGGKTWEAISAETGDLFLYMAIAPSNPDFLYAANDQNGILQSKDSGKTWQPLF
ncbi:MAG: hypothetical protein F6J94_17590 [Moorea sp. SIO1F2]|nr:hypothetical protein [Moorena sp. SIO1F2]